MIKTNNISSNFWIESISANIANVSSLDASIQTDKSFLSPAGSPGILYFPIVFLIVLMDSNQGDSMINSCRISTLVHDSS